MLVLSRRVGEQVYITLPTGEVITVMITSARDGTIRMGIEAPKNVAIARSNIVNKEPKHEGDVN